MLGRVRACSLSSLEALEMERNPSKLLKDDPLSIYEKTLLKLQKGSQRDQSVIPEEFTNTCTSSSMATISSSEASVEVNASDYASNGLLSDSGNSRSMNVSKEESHGNLSVVYMFSRYKTSQYKDTSSSDDNAMAMEDYCSSENTSPSHDPELQQGCTVDPPSPV